MEIVNLFSLTEHKNMVNEKNEFTNKPKARKSYQKYNDAISISNFEVFDIKSLKPVGYINY